MADKLKHKKLVFGQVASCILSGIICLIFVSLFISLAHVVKDSKLQKIETIEIQSLKVNKTTNFAVSLGAPVSYSSYLNDRSVNYKIDHNSSGHFAWLASQNQLGEWIQVYQDRPKKWTGLIIQGRGDYNQWVRTILVAFSSDGQLWQYADNGKQYQACSDRDSKVKITFNEPFIAKTLRIYPQTWFGSVALRFQAIYQDIE